MNTNNKTAIVTGGASGLGLAISKYLLESGVKVAIVDFNQQNLDSINNKFIKHLCDVGDSEQVAAVIENLNKELGGIDILVNSAGQIHSEPLINIMSRDDKKHSYANWDRIIRNDLSSVFYMTVNVAEKMVAARRKGVIINISSVCASGNAGQCAYSAAKAGVDSFTKVIAKELGPLGIRSVSIAPGFIDTESTKVALNENIIDGLVKATPLRKLGTADSIVETIKYIIACDYLTGCTIHVNGGLTI